jgi:hypothetical protein
VRRPEKERGSLVYKRIAILILMVLCSFSFAVAQQEGAKVTTPVTAVALKSIDECKALCESFIQLLDRSKFDEAFLILKPYWPLPENEIATLQMQTVTQLNTIAPRFGEIVGSEFVSKKVVNDFIVRFNYVQKRQNHIIRWDFVFYKPKDSWLINSVRFDDSIDALLQ